MTRLATADLRRLFVTKGLYEQNQRTIDRVREVLQIGNIPRAHGTAYAVVDRWNHRLRAAILTDAPDFRVLAGLRCMPDYRLTDAALQAIKAKGATTPGAKPGEPLATAGDMDRVLREDPGKKHMMSPCSPLEAAALDSLGQCEALLGGQAGNVAWALHCSGIRVALYSPIFSPQAVRVAGKLGLAKLALLRVAKRGGRLHLEERGVHDMPEDASWPTEASIVHTSNGTRTIFGFSGFRSLSAASEKPPFDTVRFHLGGEELGRLDRGEVEKRTGIANSWPRLPFFAAWELSAGALEVALATREDVSRLFGHRLDYAALGGLDALFYDDWLSANGHLQLRLMDATVSQLQGLRDAGVRIGVELSGEPNVAWDLLLRALCASGIVPVLGINGYDELPKVCPFGDTRPADRGYECKMYGAALALCRSHPVRTLYVHTNNLDLVLQREASAGSLLRAQQGIMAAKGRVIVALLHRQARLRGEADDRWVDHAGDVLPAVKPEAMERLARFALELGTRANDPNAVERLLTQGYWLPPVEGYSVAVAPVLWPDDSTSMRVNVTGAGDMTFAFSVILGAM